jgi:hypothetical protein
VKVLEKTDGLVDVVGVPELRVIDVFDSGLGTERREELFAWISDIHLRYFPESPHAVAEWREQLDTGISPTMEVVHPWLILRDGKPVGEWVVTVNQPAGVVLMLFGAVDKSARSDLPREWLGRFLTFLIDRCQQEATLAGFPLHAVILESEQSHQSRWESAGFIHADVGYLEPELGMHWSDQTEVRFIDSNLAFIRPIAGISGKPESELFVRALRALLIDHYGLPEDLPQVQAMLTRAAALSINQN